MPLAHSTTVCPAFFKAKLSISLIFLSSSAMLALAASKYRQTIIMVTHDKQMAGYADRVLSIVDGNVSSEVNV